MEVSESISTTFVPDRRIPTFNADAISARACLREGWSLIKDQYWLLTGICLVGYLIAGMAPMYLLYGPMLTGISYCLLRVKQGEPLEFVHLFKGFDHFGPGFFVGLVQVLPAVVVGIPLYLLAIAGNRWWAMRQGPAADPGAVRLFLFGGIALAWTLVIVVSVVTHLLFEFSFCLVVEWKLPAGQALKLSAQAVRANLSGALALFFLSGLVMLAGFLLCGIGMYLAVPLCHAAWTIAYRQVFPPYPYHLDVPPDPPVWSEWETASLTAEGSTGD